MDLIFVNTLKNKEFILKACYKHDLSDAKYDFLRYVRQLNEDTV